LTLMDCSSSCQTPIDRYTTSTTMLRQQLIRSLKRPATQAGFNGSRAFTASARRPAEVELTIGLCHSPRPRRHAC